MWGHASFHMFNRLIGREDNSGWREMSSKEWWLHTSYQILQKTWIWKKYKHHRKDPRKGKKGNVSQALYTVKIYFNVKKRFQMKGIHHEQNQNARSQHEKWNQRVDVLFRHNVEQQEGQTSGQKRVQFNHCLNAYRYLKRTYNIVLQFTMCTQISIYNDYSIKQTVHLCDWTLHVPIIQVERDHI